MKNDKMILQFEKVLKRKGLTPATVNLFREIIYSHYNENGRDLPWRKTRNPYHILVSEIMLQQTQVERVSGKYEEFIKAFPDFFALSQAPLQKILKVWQGLGYNRRAIALRKIAETITEHYNGNLPASWQELINLPGIGKATASEISAFAFNECTVFIETNIRTVFIYFFFRENSLVKDSEILPLVEKTLDKNNPREWYYAVMDYGVMLKKKYPGLNKLSAHYHKQSPFKGSNRQIRGMVLRVLTAKGELTEKEIVKEIRKSPERVLKILLQLQEEGFIRKNGRKYSIA